MAAHETCRFEIFLFAVWFIYLIAKPLYFFPKGLPQISDMVLLAGMIPAAFMMFMRQDSRISMAALMGGMFAGLTVAVNMMNYIFLPDMKFILSGLYYPYNFLIFLFVVELFRRDARLMTRLSVAGIFTGLVVQFMTLGFFMGDAHGRLSGDFKNPNQLAYWALLSAGMLVFLRRNSKFGIVEFGAIAVAAYMQTLALSKAGIIAFGLFAMVLVFVPQVPRFAKVMIAFLVLFAGSYLFFSGSQDYGGAAERVLNRLGTIGLEPDDSLAGRGYDRMEEYPYYMIVGAGEGGFERFRNWGGPGELHSGLATILFSYGVLGFVLFISFLFTIFRGQAWYYTAVLFTVLLFSLTSQTIRFTHTWVFLGIAYGSVMALRRQEEHEETDGPAAIPSPQQS